MTMIIASWSGVAGHEAKDALRPPADPQLQGSHPRAGDTPVLSLLGNSSPKWGEFRHFRETMGNLGNSTAI